MADPIAELARRLEKAGSFRALAAELNSSAGHLHHVLNRRKAPGDDLLEALGYEAVVKPVTYRRRKQQQ